MLACDFMSVAVCCGCASFRLGSVTPRGTHASSGLEVGEALSKFLLQFGGGGRLERMRVNRSPRKRKKIPRQCKRLILTPECLLATWSLRPPSLTVDMNTCCGASPASSREATSEKQGLRNVAAFAAPQ